MRTLHFRMPHFRPPHRAAPHEGEHRHHHEPGFKRLRQAENIVDYLIVGGIVLLGAAMAYGLITASGESSWW